MRTLLRDAAGTWLPRAIHPLFDSMLWRLPAAEGAKRLALTFDDGPTDTTVLLLDALGDVPATFFLIGQNAKRRPDLVRELIDRGHEIGNHSWSHINGWRESVPTLVREYRRTDGLLRELTGRPVRWVRPPFGKFTYPLIHWARRRGQRVVLWDTMPADYSPRATVPRVVRTLRSARDRSIICMHDNERSASITPQVLRETLPRLIDAGWTFVPLSDSGLTG